MTSATPGQPRSLLLPVAATIILASIIEVWVVVAVGKAIGPAWTLLLLLLTSVAGAALLRQQGSRAWRAFRTDLAEGRPPGPAATDGVMVLVGGIMMMVPGFVSDVAGVLLLLPPTRHLLRGFAQRIAVERMGSATAMSLFGPRRVHVRQPWSYGGGSGRYGSGGPNGDVRSGARAHDPEQRPGERGEPIEGEIIDPH